MQPPAYVDGKLLRFRAGQEHAVAQCVKEFAVADPLFPFHEIFMHDRNVRGGAAEADPAQFPPEPQSLSKSRVHCLVLQIVNHL
jgi:hypothetical protein